MHFPQELNDQLRQQLLTEKDGSLTMPVFVFNCCHCDLAASLGGAGVAELGRSKIYDYRNAQSTDSVKLICNPCDSIC